MKGIENKEKSFEECSRTSQYLKKKQIIAQNSSMRIIESAKDLMESREPQYKKKLKLIEDIDLKDLEKKIRKQK